MKKETNTVRIQDDLYKNVNGKWMEEAIIPADQPYTASFAIIDLEVEKKLMDDFNKLAKGEESSDVLALSDAIKLYTKAMDVASRSKDGIKPVLPLLEKIKSIKNINEYNEASLDLLKECAHFPFTFEVTENPFDTTKYCLSILDPMVILYDKTLYDKKIIKFFALMVYKKMMTKLLSFTPLTKDEQRLYLKDAIKFDDLLRQKVKSPTELADYIKLFNKFSVSEVNNKLNGFDLEGLLKKLYGDNAPVEIGVGSPLFVEGFKEILNEETFDMFIHWVYVNTLQDYAPALSKEISDIANMFMNKFMGVKENPTIEKQAYRLVSSVYDQPIGVYYGKKYFGEKAKEDITDLTNKVISTYKDRVAKNDFLDPSTKQKAILKLDCMKVKMGYPDNYDSFYDTLKVNDNDSFFEAMSKITKAKKMHQFELLNKPTDFSKWSMPAHMVNACYDPFKNDITFPAAILQKPFYDLNQSIEENLGGIGAVIAHEISHAFDNNGAHMDEKGMLNDWWKEEDFKKFELRTEDMVKQYDGIPFHGGKVNGKLVVSENIADNGGMAATLQIMHSLDNPNYQAYFINWAKIWRNKAKESFYKLLLRVDVHSPSELRANITPRNFDEWYEAFDVKETDKMYIPKEKRISIW